MLCRRGEGVSPWVHLLGGTEGCQRIPFFFVVSTLLFIGLLLTRIEREGFVEPLLIYLYVIEYSQLGSNFTEFLYRVRPLNLKSQNAQEAPKWW